MTDSNEKTLRILVTDSQESSALAVIRSFGHAGHEVIAAHCPQPGHRAPSLASRYCTGQRVHPNVLAQRAEFRDWLKEAILHDRPDVLVPVSEAAISVCNSIAADLPPEVILLTPAVTAGAGKSESIHLAQENGMPVPPTCYFSNSRSAGNSPNDSLSCMDEFRYPVVLRTDSMVDRAGAFKRGQAYLCRDRDALQRHMELAQRSAAAFLVQEFVSGHSEVVFLLCQQGEVSMHFAFRSLHQVPPWGGQPTLRESTDSAGLAGESIPLLEACAYSGLARLEFREGKDGRRYFIGLGGNPWESLNAVAQARADFPLAWLELSRRRPAKAQLRSARTGIRTRSTCPGEIEYLKFSMADQGGRKPGLLQRVAAGASLCNSMFNPFLLHDQFSWSDPSPGFVAARASLVREARRIVIPAVDALQRKAAAHKGAADPIARRNEAGGDRLRPKPEVRGPKRQGPGNHSPIYPLRIFMFHGIVDQALEVPHFCFLEKPCFESQLGLIGKNYQVRQLEDAVRDLREGRLCEPTAAITFDDGFQSNFTLAFPELKRGNMPASIFVSTGFTDTDQAPWFCRVLRAISDTSLAGMGWNGRHFDLSGRGGKSYAAAAIMTDLKQLPQSLLEAETDAFETILGFEARRPLELDSPFRMLSSGAIKTMADSGLIDFGGHTASHSILSHLSVNEQRNEIRSSLESLGLITGQACRQFAYPNGRSADYGSESIDVLKQQEISLGLTAMPGGNFRTTNPLELKREAIGPEDTPARFKRRIQRMLKQDHRDAIRV